MAKLSTLLFVNPHQHAIGLDVTDGALRYVQIKRSGRGISLRRFGSVPLPTGVIADGELVNPQQFQTTMQLVLKRLHQGYGGTRFIHLAIPDRHVYLKFLELKQTNEHDRDETIRWETAQYVPYDLRELNISWTSVAPTDSAVPEAALAAAVPTSIAEQYIQSLERVGCTVLSLQPSAAALLKVLEPQVVDGQESAFVAFLGDETSTGMIIQNGTPHLTSALPMTTTSQRAAIQKHFSLQEQDAERARQTLGFSRTKAHGMVFRALAPQLDQLTDRIRQIAAFHMAHHPKATPVTRLFLGGPASAANELLPVVAKALQLPVALTKSSIAPKGSTNRSFIAQEQEYLIALGLALSSPIHA